MPTLQNPNPAIIDPATLSGIRARYKLSASGLVAGSITGQTIPDLSGNGRDLTVSGAATYYPSRINGKGAVVFGGGSAQAAGFFADVPGDWSVVAVHKVGPNVEPWWDGTAGWWCRLNSASPPVMTFLGIQTKANALSRNDGWQSYCGVQDSNPNSPYVGGRYSQDFSGWESSNAGGMSTSDRPLIICRDGAYELAEWIYFDRCLTWAERVAISRYFNAEYGVYSPFVDGGSGVKPFLIAVGNSTTQFPKWPSQLVAGTTDAIGGAANLGIAGGTAATIDQQAPEMLDLATTLRTLGVPILKIAHHGHNNSYTVIDQFATATFSGPRAIGEKLMVTTSTPYNDNDAAEANRTELNDWIRGKSAQVTTHGNPLAVMDFAVDAFGKDYEDPPTNSVISYTGKFSNASESIVGSRTTYGSDYWSDNIHPTELAGGKMAGYIQQAVRDALPSLAGLVDPKTIAVGSTTSSTASLTAPAATGGFAPYAYQWYRNGAAISGATSATLDDTGLTASTTYAYVRRATDAGGYYRETPPVNATTTSAGAPLTLSLDSSAITSSSATVTATSGGGTGSKSYAWTRNGSTVSGQTGAVLSLTGLSPSTSYTIGCTVTDAASATASASTTVTTSAASAALSVTLATSAIAATSATVTATPGGGTGSKSYAWTRDGSTVSGQTGAVLSLTGLAPSTSYAVGVTVTDSATPTPGTATASTTVTTSAGGAALSVSLAKTGGTATTLTITATPSGGTGSKTYAWTRDGTPVSGQATAVLTLTGLSPATTYAIAVTATDAASATATASLSATTADASPTYYRVNNGISRVSAPKLVGDPGITVANPERFGTQFPMKVTVFRRTTSDPLVPYTPLAIYRVVARSGNQLVFDAAIEGTEDVKLQDGDVAANVRTAGDD